MKLFIEVTPASNPNAKICINIAHIFGVSVIEGTCRIGVNIAHNRKIGEDIVVVEPYEEIKSALESAQL